MGGKELRRRAKAVGMPTSELEKAMDSNEPEECFIGFLHQQQEVQATTDADLVATGGGLISWVWVGGPRTHAAG